ncbi:MAG: DUF2232 domain-containing protein [Clostridia bacterium]|nr:DUF2232 domain-containing protein [Clostridia bacterium]
MFGLTGLTPAFILSGSALSLLVVNSSMGIIFPVVGISLVFSVMGGLSSFVLFLLSGILPGLFLGHCYKKKEALPVLVTTASACHITGWVSLYFMYKSTQGSSLFEDIAKQFVISANTAMDQMVKNAGIPDAQKLISPLKESIETTGEYFKILVPAFIIILSACAGLLTVMLSKKKAGYNVTPFSEIYIPTSMSFICLVFCIAGFIVKDVNTLGFIANIIVIAFSYFVLCGVSACDYFLKKKIASDYFRIFILIAGLFILSLFFSGIIFSVLLLLGMTDASFDLRKLRRKAPKGE